ncbi:hypothetical protein FPV16_09930 [Methylobacterium sp. W2]|uniref:hypothetical protein n=1 Tax=Methylobacterium sp. W2 TaxID=2598107 RepID=UPI001D0C3460|nr:hypothetical protein [Methylobacterium sp. W2]MCC0806534.1 hypothetical protein [Methylobacterium sp. W2]
MRIPEIRVQMRAVAAEISDPVLREMILVWVRELYRRPAVRMTVPRNRPMTPELAAAIEQHAAAHPNEGYHAMSLRFSVGVGRVSEVLAGRRV